MMWMWLAALAATPDDLAVLVPEAEDQLARCAVDGCDADDGARAAWILAVHTYVDQGEADGVLAATVQVLDGELFETLPAPVRDARSEPLPWSITGTPTATAGAPEASSDEEAQRRRPKKPVFLTVQVIDDQGAPVPHATVRFPEEGESHRVNQRLGTWMGTLLYLPNGDERSFEKRASYQMEVFAAGYELQEVVFVLPRRKQHDVTVQLTPVERKAPEGAPASAHQAVAAHRDWIAAEAAQLTSPSSENQQANWVARRRTAGFAKAWLEQGGGGDAWELCVMGRSRTYCGERP